MKCALEDAKDNLRDEKAIAFFFNARDHDLERSVEGMYRSLLSQLLCSFPKLDLPLGPSNITQHFGAIASLRNQFSKAVLSLESGIAVSSYIDALNECDEDEIREALEHFEELGALSLLRGSKLCICFASRYYPQVTIQHCTEMKLEIQIEHQRDIERYVHSRLAIRDPTIRSELAQLIKVRSSGVFFWVVLVVRMLKKKSDRGASRSALLETLRQVPGKLQEMFANVLEYPDDELISVLRWVLYATRPLELQELYFAIRTSTGDLKSGAWNYEEVDLIAMENFVLTAFRGLVETTWSKMKELSEAMTKTQLVHESVREYLLEGGLARMDDCYADNIAAHSHFMLFKDCRQYFRLDSKAHCAEGQTVEQLGCMGYAMNATLYVRRKVDMWLETFAMLRYALSAAFEHLEKSLRCEATRPVLSARLPCGSLVYPLVGRKPPATQPSVFSCL